MTLSIIALIVSVVYLTAGIIIYRNNNNQNYKIHSIDVSLNSARKALYNLSKEVQPLIDKHKEEQKQKLIETRKAHWKSFNTWKFRKGMFEENFEKDKDNTVCGECLSDGLKLTVDYKELEERNMYGFGYHTKKDYPISAELKCTVCNHVADRWEYKE